MVDPSENWKQWGGGGTCIGKGEDLVRKRLYQKLYDKNDTKILRDDDKSPMQKQCLYPSIWVRALDVSMEATFKAMDPDEYACDDEMIMNKNTDSRL